MTKEFSHQVRVYYEDTDAGGVVFYANYLRFMERARTEWLRSRGFIHERLAEKEQIIFVVKRVNIHYKKPAVLDDLLTITSNIIKIRGASLDFKQQIHNEAGEAISEAEITVACVNINTLKPEAIPESILLEMAHVD